MGQKWKIYGSETQKSQGMCRIKIDVVLLFCVLNEESLSLYCGKPSTKLIIGLLFCYQTFSRLYQLRFLRKREIRRIITHAMLYQSFHILFISSGFQLMLCLYWHLHDHTIVIVLWNMLLSNSYEYKFFALRNKRTSFVFIDFLLQNDFVILIFRLNMALCIFKVLNKQYRSK